MPLPPALHLPALQDDPNLLVVHLKRFDATMYGTKVSEQGKPPLFPWAMYGTKVSEQGKPPLFPCLRACMCA